MDQPQEPPIPRAADLPLQLLRAACLATLMLLVGLGIAWELWLAPTGRGTLALKVLPLLAAPAGLLRHRLYTYRWLSLLVWVYIGEGLWRWTGPAASRAPAVAETLLGLLLFALCVLYIRRRLRGATRAAVAAGTA